ncbi:hypothetical protein AQUCO_01400664v1 [Aquilegia coerulea]|uniref:EF-hand domain-containing protein n=1 Tax=Aquilegia coerulea TaxID=218851 RepID=A0A2G5DXI7_AQUCA|nr:hypothetical protein AQUCO_01400664v1 [Aquilegia coerulea]
MKLITQLNPKHLFRSKKSSSVSRSDPFSSGSYSSSSDGSSTNLKERIQLGSTTPTTVLPSRNQFLIHSSKSHNDDEIISDFSSEIHLDLVQAFKLMDKDGDGKITRRELETLLKRVGADPLSEEEVKMMLTDVDREESGGGCISLEKFGEISSAFGPACDSEIRDTFDFFDVDRDGKISAEELLGVFVSIGDNQCTLEDCQRMIAGVDSDGDGFVCFEDFTRMMEHQR